MDLQEWVNNHKPGEEMYWYQGFWDQIYFVRDELAWLLREGDQRVPVKCVSSHTSKSIQLPVYEIETSLFTIRLRYNFFNWVVSVESKYPVRDRFRNLFDREAEVMSIYAEGFQDEWVHPSYSENRSKFTLFLGSKYEVWTFCWLLSQDRS